MSSGLNKDVERYLMDNQTQKPTQTCTHTHIHHVTDMHTHTHTPYHRHAHTHIHHVTDMHTYTLSQVISNVNFESKNIVSKKKIIQKYVFSN